MENKKFRNPLLRKAAKRKLQNAKGYSLLEMLLKIRNQEIAVKN
jgi:hypothetical protein